MKKETKNETKLVSNIERGQRIREERKRLRLTQQDVANACNVHRVQWGRYERGEQGFDGEPLRKFGELGASVVYILTGERSNVTRIGQIAPAKAKMSDDEQLLLQQYRQLDDAGKQAINAMMTALLGS